MTVTDTLCVVQARTGSTRLPGKVLQDVAGRPMLRFMLDRLASLPALVVATSSLDRDDPIAEIATAAGRPVVRGPEEDVLARFGAALDAHPAEHVVRLTADCPLMDPDLVAAVVDHHRAVAADYTCNVLPRTFPKGLDVEVVRADVLRVAVAEACDGSEREHVTPFIYRRPECFRLANVRNDAPLGDERWTVDTIDDLAFVRDLVARLGDDRFGWRDALEVVGRSHAEPSDEVVLVPAALEHSVFWLACRSDDDAVRWSRSGRVIPAAEHAAWYERVCGDPGVRMRIASLDGEPVGIARADVNGGVAEVGLAVAPAFRGRGLATQILEAQVADCRADEQVTDLVAVVHPGNEASLAAFRAAGYTPDPAAGPGSDGFRRLRRAVKTPIRTP